jgi:predicted metal-dependent HD superfamily phosphohydrolase
VVDIDLSILGRAPGVYDRYEAAIREEYKWVPQVTYRRERRAVLWSFLEREKIYGMGQFRALYEEPARQNLTRAIDLV